MSQADFDLTSDMTPDAYLQHLEREIDATLARGAVRPMPEIGADEAPSKAIYVIAVGFGIAALVMGLGADWIWGCADHFCGVDLETMK